MFLEILQELFAANGDLLQRITGKTCQNKAKMSNL